MQQFYSCLEASGKFTWKYTAIFGVLLTIVALVFLSVSVRLFEAVGMLAPAIILVLWGLTTISVGIYSYFSKRHRPIKTDKLSSKTHRHILDDFFEDEEGK